MKPATLSEALFYPFHLCHEETLMNLCRRFSKVHFRDFMALQLTPFTGMTAYPEQMGDSHPDLLAAGILVQGYPVSGPLADDVEAAIDRDLCDPAWRRLFDASLRNDRRFQAGLFDTGAADRLMQEPLASESYTVALVKGRLPKANYDDPASDYGVALLKTSAALVYTYRLALAHGLQAVTDSPAHFALFDRTLVREGLALGNHLVVRKGY